MQENITPSKPCLRVSFSNHNHVPVHNSGVKCVCVFFYTVIDMTHLFGLACFQIIKIEIFVRKQKKTSHPVLHMIHTLFTVHGSLVEHG